jgi:hypothetical protein
MMNIADARLNRFASPEDPIIEIPHSELIAIFNESIELFNSCLDLIREQKLMNKKDSAKLLIHAEESIKNEKSPVSKLILLNAFIKKALKPIKDTIRSRPTTHNSENIIQASTKIKLRAVMLYDHIKSLAKGGKESTRKKDFAFDSRDVRTLLAGKEGQAPSRRDAIRAMLKAERIYPALRCEHTPGDGRQTMRLIINVNDINYFSIIKDEVERSNWQRFRTSEVLPFINSNQM